MRSVVPFGDTDIAGSIYNLVDDYGTLITDGDGTQIVSDDWSDLTQPSDVMFDQIVSESHEIAIRCDVVRGGEVIAPDVPLVSASFAYNRNAPRFARVSNVVISDPTRVPASALDRLSPYGYELQMWRGVAVADGSLMVPLGVFPIQRSAMDAVQRSTEVAAMDRSQRVSDARFEDDYEVPAGTNYATAIEDMITAGVPGLTFLFPSTTHTTPPVLTFSRLSDRWLAAVEMAKSIGMKILFDGLGRCEMRPEPSFTASTSDYRIVEAENLITAEVTLDRLPAYNRVIATSANASTGTVYEGIATDDDPASLTFYDGPFGKKPRGFSSAFINSNAQATSAAQAILQSNLGVAATTVVSAVPNPRIEPSDIGLVTASDVGINERHILDTQRFSLSPSSAMIGNVRARQEAA